MLNGGLEHGDDDVALVRAVGHDHDSVIDIIPPIDSGETNQDAEPSLAVNPTDPSQIIAGAFLGTGGIGGSSFYSEYYISNDGGTAWSNYGSLISDDKSLAWLQNGSSFVTGDLKTNGNIETYSGTPSGTFHLINDFGPGTAGTGGTGGTGGFGGNLDQPWIRTGPSGHVYLAYNNLNLATSAGGGGGTASVNVSNDGGTTYTAVVIDKVGSPVAGQDAPAVRVAVNGSTVYAAFIRWDTFAASDGDGDSLYNAHVVVVRGDNNGADSFGDLGTNGTGVVVAANTDIIGNGNDAPLSVGQERPGANLAIAVDPNNANHLYIAYGNTPGTIGTSGTTELIVAESADGGQTWKTVYTTPTVTNTGSLAARSGQPALAVLDDGAVGFLYDNYDPNTDMLSQHFVTTSNDFTTTADTVLGTEANSVPASDFEPYLGDFFDLQAVGNTFYGVFSASNADNGTLAWISDVTYLRDHTGTPGTASFRLTTGGGGGVGPSIDPYFFTATALVNNGPTVVPFVKDVGVAKNVPLDIATYTDPVGLANHNPVLIAAPSRGTLAASHGRVTYTETLNPTLDQFSYKLTDKDGLSSPVLTGIIGAGGNYTITGAASGYTAVVTGGGPSTFTLFGSNNVVRFGHNTNTVTDATANGGDNTVIGSTGPTVVSLTGSGGNNSVALGSGKDTITVGGLDNAITLGRGRDVVNGGADDTISLTGSTKLTVSGRNETVFVGPGGGSVSDQGTGTAIGVGPTATGLESIFHFSADLADGVIDLLGGVGGITSAAAAYAALTSDGKGGSMLPLGAGPTIDISGVTPAMLSAANFRIG